VRQNLALAVLSVITFTTNPVARGQVVPSRVRGPIDDQRVVRVEHTKHPLATTANSEGRVEANASLERMLLVLSLSAEQEQELRQLLDEQQTKGSSNYHHWLTAAEYGARFGVTDVDVQKVRGWLESSGFAVGKVAQSKRWIEFSGTAQQVENAFHTEMQYYRVGRKTHIANATDVAVPEALAEVVRGVASLNNFEKRPPRHVAEGVAGRDSQGQKIRLQPSLTPVGATNTYYLTPEDLSAVFNTKALLSAGIDGSGISIAVTAQSNIELTDVQKFRQIFRLKANDPNVVVSGLDPGVASQADAEEAQLEVEWAGAVAPGATIDLVVAGSTATTSGVDLAAAYAIDNEVAPILTYTYGSCEQALGAAGNAFYNALWQEAAAEGITVLVAVGDNGAAGCEDTTAGVAAGQGQAVNGAASTPYNIAVGGTEFAEGASLSTYRNNSSATDFSLALGYILEAAENENCDPMRAASETNCAYGGAKFSSLAGGGGTSAVYAKPVWQTGPGIPADGARDVPDLSIATASGHDDLVYCTSLGGTPCQLNGQSVMGLTVARGTSPATAAMAGILALVEQENGAFQGQANYVLYELAQMQGNRCAASKQIGPAAEDACVFYDVTAGSNSVPCAGGSAGCSSTVAGTNGFLTGNAAGPAYDLATGLGSVNAANLASAWKNVIAGARTKPQQVIGSFTLAVSPTPVPIAAGSPGSATVIVTPNGGFAGTVALTCATGGTMPPVGYACSFAEANVPVSGGPASTQLNLTLSTPAVMGVKSVGKVAAGSVRRGMGLVAAVLLLGMAGIAASGGKSGRNFLLYAGLVVGIFGVVLGCGGGGSAGQVATTTTVSSSIAKAGFGTPVTFNVLVVPKGSATPTGSVQLFDNGSAFGNAAKVNAGIVSFLTTNLPVGVHVITAQYLGDTNTLGSTSAPITQVITGNVAMQITGTSNGIVQTANFNVAVN
jgi:subtilase family serine protease